MNIPRQARRQFLRVTTTAALAFPHFSRAREICESDGALDYRRDLEGNFIDALRGNGPVHCNAELGCATMVAIKMAVESYRQRKTMLWDAKAEKVSAS